jgi:1,4-dihydroxy-2-naphthoate octaprenyltransferase
MKTKPLPEPGSVGAWILAARPKTLVAGWAPVLVGTAFGVFDGDGRLRVVRAAAALIVALAIQIGTNLVNDAADSKRGADKAGRLGPPRAVAEGLLSGKVAVTGGLTCFGIAGLNGLWLASVSGWWLLIPGGLAIVAGIAYTAGPKPLAYLGLGEIFVFIFFGLFATSGSAFVQFTGTGANEQAGLIASLVFGASLGLFSVGILEINNIRDAPTDVAVGKATLAVRLGDANARGLFVGCIVGPFVLMVLTAAFAISDLSAALVLLTLLSIPLAIPSVKAVQSGAVGRELNPVLGAVARLEAVFAFLLAVSFGLIYLIPFHE